MSMEIKYCPRCNGRMYQQGNAWVCVKCKNIIRIPSLVLVFIFLTLMCSGQKIKMNQFDFLSVPIGCVYPQYKQHGFIVVGKTPKGYTEPIPVISKHRHHYIIKEDNVWKIGDTVWLYRWEYYEISPGF